MDVRDGAKRAPNGFATGEIISGGSSNNRPGGTNTQPAQYWPDVSQGNAADGRDAVYL